MSYVINQSLEKFISLVNILYQLFLKDKREGYLSRTDADDEQSKFAYLSKSIDKGITSIKKINS